MELGAGVGAVLRVLGVVGLGVAGLTAVRAALATGGSAWTHHVVRLTGSLLERVARRLPERAGERVIGLTASTGLLLVLAVWLAVWQAGVALAAAPAVVEEVGRVALLVLFGVLVLRTGQAHERRERHCAAFSDGCGAEELLAGFLGVGGRERLDLAFVDWAVWLAELRRAHGAWPTLLHARPSGVPCWLETVVTMLDVAALVEAIAPGWASPHTTAVLLNGTDCLDRALVAVGVQAPRSAISLHGREDRGFDDTVRLLTGAGLPAERDAADAWGEFQARRTRYAPAASALAVRLFYARFEESR